VSEVKLAFTIEDQDTAAALGSGTLPVLGTPRLLAWCETATCAAIAPDLAEGETSVGTRVELEHTRQPGRHPDRGHRLSGLPRRPAPSVQRAGP
jgi:predicted thioesterase